MREIKYFFDNIKSKRKVLMLMSCHSEISEEIRRKGFDKIMPFEEIPKSSIVISSTTWDQDSFEDDRLRAGVFSHFFSKALKTKKDDDGNGAVNVTEAFNYASYNTYYHTKGKQKAVAKSDTHMLGANTIYLVGEKNRKSTPVLYDYTDRFA